MKDLFNHIAKEFSDRIALSDELGTATYAEIARNAEALHEQLLSPGTIVLVALPGGAAFTILQLACFAAKAIFVPIPHQSTRREALTFAELVDPEVVAVVSLVEQAAVVQACSPNTIILTLEEDPAGIAGRTIVAMRELLTTAPAHRGLRRSSKSPFPKETRTIQFTSGSTGIPKGILLSNDNWRSTLEQNQEHLSKFLGKHVFCPLPQFHAMGSSVVVEHLWNGSPVHISNEFLPGEHVRRLQQYHCAAILASPNYIKLMSRLGAISASTLPDLSSITIGTAVIDEVLVRELRDLFPAIDIHCRYGLSESVGCMVRLTLGPGRMLPQKGLIGWPVPGVELQKDLPSVGEAAPGELKVKSGANAIGVATSRGKWCSLLDEAGFLSTGDLACLTEHGQLVLRGRLSTFLKSNGYRINPLEIEDVLRAIPRVQEAVVVGVPDTVAGHRVVACLEASPGQVPPKSSELLRVCEVELLAQKVPQGFLVLCPLPRTPAGKPDRAKCLDAAVEWVANTAAAATIQRADDLRRPERVMSIVSRIISDNVGQAVTLKSDEDLAAAGYLDSLTLVSVVLGLEEEFDIQIPLVNLTPEDFRSIDMIVGRLFPNDGQLFPSLDAAQTVVVRAPNRSLILTAALSGLMLMLFASAPSDYRGPLSYRRVEQAILACRGCADLVITGSSQASVNLSPTVLGSELPVGMKVFNLGLPVQPYSEKYLNLIDKSLSQSPRRSVLAVITPVSLVPRDQDDRVEPTVRPAGKAQVVSASLDAIRSFFHSRDPCEFLFGVCGHHRYTWGYDDGWIPESTTGLDTPTALAPAMSRFMRRWAAILRYKPEDHDNFLSRIRSWRKAGVHVFTLRAPVPRMMFDAEAAMENYDEPTMLRRFADAGATWISIDPTKYDCFDGWHMNRGVAERFSLDVGKQVAALLDEESRPSRHGAKEGP